MKPKYIVHLTESNRTFLKHLISSGSAPARKIRRAQILLKADCSEEGPNWSNQTMCEAYGVSNVTVTEIRRTFVKQGLEAVINRKKPEREYEHRLDGEAEAHLIALACSEAPDGKERWTLRLLRDRMIQLEYVEDVSHETIRTTLKKTNLSLG